VRTARALTAALLAAGALALPAAPALAAAAPGSAATAAPAADPARNAVVRKVHITCTGDTVTGSALLRGGKAGRAATVTLIAKQGKGAWAATGRSVRIAGAPGRQTITWSFNVAGLPAGVTSYRASVSAGPDTVASNVLPVSRCAPGEEIPEAPMAVLVPATLAATAAGVFGLSRLQAAR
jgi:hypothetical protein